MRRTPSEQRIMRVYGRHWSTPSRAYKSRIRSIHKRFDDYDIAIQQWPSHLFGYEPFRTTYLWHTSNALRGYGQFHAEGHARSFRAAMHEATAVMRLHERGML